MITIFEDTVYMQTPEETRELFSMRNHPYQFIEMKTCFAILSEEKIYTADAEEEYSTMLSVYTKSDFNQIFEYSFMETDANWMMLSPTNPYEVYIGFVNSIYKYNITEQRVDIRIYNSDSFLSGMCFQGDKIITLSRNGCIRLWGENTKEYEREIIIFNQRMASCIHTVGEHILIWTHTTTTQTQVLFLLNADFYIINKVELPRSTFTNLYKIKDNVFLGIHHKSITTKELSIIEIREDISIRRVPFTGRIVDPAIPHDGKLLIDKGTSYGWFNIHTYEMEPCDGLRGNISFYYPISK